MKAVGLDVHRNFAQAAMVENGLVKNHGRFAMNRDAILKLAETLTKGDDVVLEATGNTAAIVRLLTPFAHRVVIANPLQVRAIAWAKVKTDKIDAATLARLHAAQFLLEVWMPTEEVAERRRVIAERTQLVSQMTRLKNRINSILHANLMPQQTGRIFSVKGHAALEALPLPIDQIRMALRHHDEIQRLARELEVIDAANDDDPGRCSLTATVRTRPWWTLSTTQVAPALHAPLSRRRVRPGRRRGRGHGEFCDVGDDETHPQRRGRPLVMRPTTTTLPAAPQRLFLTLMFCDLCGSSQLAGQLELEVLADLLERVRLAVCAAVLRHVGRVVRSQGDGSLAVFGYSAPSEHDARRAC